MKINYVIATYAGTKCVSDRDRFTTLSTHPKDYLKVHLRQLIDLPHNLTQVTIMKAAVPPGVTSWPGYYDITDLVTELSKKLKVCVYDVPNQGISYGQYIRAYDLCKTDSFDYWVLMEDDYIPVLPNFDAELVTIHKEQRTGLLCAWATIGDVGTLHAAHALCFVDNTSMAKAFSNASGQLQKFNKQPSQIQIKFSQIFLELHIKMSDYTNYYHTPYWAGTMVVDCSGTPKNPTALFIPIQMLTPTIGSASNASGTSSVRGTGSVQGTTCTSIDYSQIPKHRCRLMQTKGTLLIPANKNVTHGTSTKKFYRLK